MKKQWETRRSSSHFISVYDDTNDFVLSTNDEERAKLIVNACNYYTKQPKTVLIKNSDVVVIDRTYICPDCGDENIKREYEYCPHCGIILKWSKRIIR